MSMEDTHLLSPVGEKGFHHQERLGLLIAMITFETSTLTNSLRLE